MRFAYGEVPVGVAVRTRNGVVIDERTGGIVASLFQYDERAL
jgi:hypothetical protein